MPTINTDYHVDKKPVTVSVIIGDAQLGSSLVLLDSQEKARGDDIKNCMIGNGPDISGKTLVVKSIVSDVSDKTNHTSISYILKGGVQDARYSLESTVANEGDSVIYRATFKLI